jgi:hypothetical protein
VTLIDLKRWHWLLIGLLLGPLLAYCQVVRRQVNGFEGDSLHRPTFERYMRECNRPAGGSQNIVVHPHPLKDRWHIVTGQRYAANSDEATAWWFEAQSPYLEGSQQRRYANVMEFLQSAGADHSPVPYRWAWWERSDLQVPLWLAGAVLFFGIVWPNLLSFIVLGTWRLPTDGICLWPLRPSGPTVAAPALQPADNAETIVVVEQMLAEAEGATPDATPLPRSAAPVLPPTPVLAPQGNSPVVDTSPAVEKAYGGEEDDFYPTEVGAHRHLARKHETG